MPGSLAAFLLAATLPTGASCAGKAVNQHVNGRILRWAAESFHVSEPFLSINLSLSVLGGGLSFSGQPISGNLSRAGSFWSVSGPGLSATVNAWGGSYQVNATISPSDPKKPPLSLSFTMQSTGSSDPKTPPSYSVWGADMSLSLRPSSDGRQYDMTGWVDSERFGALGAALVGVLATGAISERPAPAQVPAVPVVP